jgi:hypothetical protein
MFTLWFALLGGSFVFLDVGISILFLVFPFVLVLWLFYSWQGFIKPKCVNKSKELHIVGSYQC